MAPRLAGQIISELTHTEEAQNNIVQNFISVISELYNNPHDEVNKHLVHIKGADIFKIREALFLHCIENIEQHKLQESNFIINFDNPLENLRRRNKPDRCYDDLYTLAISVIEKAPHKDLGQVIKNGTCNNQEQAQQVSLLNQGEGAIIEAIHSMQDTLQELRKENKDLKTKMSLLITKTDNNLKEMRDLHQTVKSQKLIIDTLSGSRKQSEHVSVELKGNSMAAAGVDAPLHPTKPVNDDNSHPMKKGGETYAGATAKIVDVNSKKSAVEAKPSEGSEEENLQGHLNFGSGPDGGSNSGSGFPSGGFNFESFNRKDNAFPNKLPNRRNEFTKTGFINNFNGVPPNNSNANCNQTRVNPFLESYQDTFRKDDEEEYQLVQRKKRKPVYGTKALTASSKRMAGERTERDFSVFIGGVSNAFLEADMRKYIENELSIKVTGVEINKINERNRSYKVTVMRKDKDELFNPADWEENIIIKAYRVRRRENGDE